MKAEESKDWVQSSGLVYLRSFAKKDFGRLNHKLFVVSGPSGSGKGTLIKRSLKSLNGLALSVSATTRKPRKGEIEAREYYFISDKDFRKKVKAGEFLEWARVHSFLYGTLKSELQKAQKKDLLLELDTQGALSVKIIYPEAILIFIKPSREKMLEELSKRLRLRRTETEQTIKQRITDAEKELALAAKYDYNIVNIDIEEASYALIEIIKEERIK